MRTRRRMLLCSQLTDVTLHYSDNNESDPLSFVKTVHVFLILIYIKFVIVALLNAIIFYCFVYQREVF